MSCHDALSSQDPGCSSVLGKPPEAVLAARALHRLPHSCARAPTSTPRTHASARRHPVQTTQGQHGLSPSRPPTMVAVLACPVHRTRIPAPPYVARQDCSPLSVWARTLLPDAAAPAKPPAVCFHVNHPDNRVSELLSPAFKSSACSSLTVANIPTCPLWSSLFPSP